MNLLKYLLILAVCVAAALLGKLWPVLGGPVLAMIIGVALAPVAFRLNIVPVTQKISKKALLGAVVMLGLGLDSSAVGTLHGGTWIFMILTVCFGLLVTWFFSRVVGLKGPVGMLLSVGTSICGGSAIAAVAGVSQAKDEETAQALSTIFMYNILAAILFPLLGHAMGMDAERFGVWAGTAINDTSSVLAAAFAFGGVAGAVGMQVKMARTLMILPVSLGVSWWVHHKGGTTGSWKKVLPMPAIGFGAALFIRWLLPQAPVSVWHGASLLGYGLMILALACIGLGSHIVKLWKNGKKALLAGGLGWISLAVFSFTMMRVF